MLSSGLVGLSMLLLTTTTNLDLGTGLETMGLFDITMSLMEAQLGTDYQLPSDVFGDNVESINILDKLTDDGVPLGEISDSSDYDSVFVSRFTEEAANDYIKDIDKAVSAHFEYCRPDDWKMLSCDLTEQELDKVKEFIKDASVDVSKNSGYSDFTYTIHLFDEQGKYVYVIALNADKESLYVEPGGLVCDGLADYMLSFVDRARE